jgi:hypothetical protein
MVTARPRRDGHGHGHGHGPRFTVTAYGETGHDHGRRVTEAAHGPRNATASRDACHYSALRVKCRVPWR